MSSKRTYMYNIVLQENDVCPAGELLTDKELERMKLHNHRRNWPFTMKVKVKAEDVYFSFGVRMVHCGYELLPGEHSPEWLERIINSPLARALDSYCHDAIVNYINNSKNGK